MSGKVKDRIVLGEGFVYETINGFDLCSDWRRDANSKFGLMLPIPKKLFYSKMKYRVILERINP
jgi:hypothetical protein